MSGIIFPFRLMGLNAHEILTILLDVYGIGALIF